MKLSLLLLTWKNGFAEAKPFFFLCIKLLSAAAAVTATAVTFFLFIVIAAAKKYESDRKEAFAVANFPDNIVHAAVAAEQK